MPIRNPPRPPITNPSSAPCKATSRTTETSRDGWSIRLRVAGETRQPPPGATSNRRTTTWLAESAGRWLEPRGNPGPRGMTVHDRTRLIGQLHFFPRVGRSTNAPKKNGARYPGPLAFERPVLTYLRWLFGKRPL